MALLVIEDQDQALLPVVVQKFHRGLYAVARRCPREPQNSRRHAVVVRVGIDKADRHLTIQGLEGAGPGREDVVFALAEELREQGAEFLVRQFFDLGQIVGPLKPQQDVIERSFLVGRDQKRPIAIAQKMVIGSPFQGAVTPDRNPMGPD